MKKFFLIGIVLAFAVWFGCGGSDSPTDSGNGGQTGPQRVVANTTAGAPSMINANDATWNAVAASAIDMSTINSPKLSAPTSLNAPDSIYLKAIVDGGTLYLRIEYTDDSLNLLKDFYSVFDSNLNFTENTYSQEDQIYVMFAGLPNDTWDVWNWRSLTTAPARLAEGQRYENGTPIPITDTGGQVVALANRFSGSRPEWVHKNGPAFHGEILYLEDTITIDSFADPGLWVKDQIVPGYAIDTLVYWRVQPDSPYVSSRWDIFSIHDYNATTDRLSVVMKCALNTGRGDDLVMSDSVKVKIGVSDDQKDITVGGSRRGFTQEFWLIL